jgi:deoxyribodipyrimidine photo-lyase
MEKEKVALVWLRRDLRLEDNTALNQALSEQKTVLPLFIFDEDITDELPKDDARVNFIYDQLKAMNTMLRKNGSSLLVLKGKTEIVWKKLIEAYSINAVYTNKDYEPYALERDAKIHDLLKENSIPFKAFKDQVIHEQREVMKADGTPYTVFTPYKNKWLETYKPQPVAAPTAFQNFHSKNYPFPEMEKLGFKPSRIKVRDFTLKNVTSYAETRNFPDLDSTSYLSPHLRFGTISIRQVIAQLNTNASVFLSELIWREFFMQILFHFPKVVTRNFKSKYDGIQWRNDEVEFEKWCNGETGYPMVDAGMKQLNATGYMHNRVRMITAGFLCKHLLIDWRKGEAYFAKKLLDFELSSNNGNWQWAAGTGCDSAPYFRVFNPSEQLKKFDKNEKYIKTWLPDYGSIKYPEPIVEHKMARLRALETYKVGLATN